MLTKIIILNLILSLFNAMCFMETIIPRHSQCLAKQIMYDDYMKELVKDKYFASSMDKTKGHLGKIGIIGEARRNTAAYFAGISAFRVGADDVVIITTKSAMPIIAAHNPDLTVLDVMDNIIQLVIEIAKLDVIVLGPGLSEDLTKITLMVRVIRECKKLSKPLIIEMEEYFMIPQLYNNIMNYPQPGIIIITNERQFEKFYPLIKRNSAKDDVSVYIDYPKIGNNIFIMRSGCVDSGISSNPSSSWTHSTGGSPRRSPGQSHALAGMTAVFFNWALNNIYFNITGTDLTTIPAAVATYSASVLMRECNSATYAEIGASALTSDMIEKISSILHT